MDLLLPGVIITDACPKCGEVVRKSLKDDYVYLRTTGEAVGVHFFHYRDGFDIRSASDLDAVEWSVELKVNLTAELA